MELEPRPQTQVVPMDLWMCVDDLGGWLWRGGLAAPRFRKAGLSPDSPAGPCSWALSLSRRGLAQSASPAPPLGFAPGLWPPQCLLLCVPDGRVGLLGAWPPTSIASSVLVFRAQRTVSRGGCSVSVSLRCNPMDYSLSGSSIHGIFQARVQL